MDTLRREIEALGAELVGCSSPCAGITRDQATGILPRCLVLETDGRDASRGCAVVGINPGRASDRERASYRQAHGTYAAIVEWFDVVGFTHRYYTSLRRVVTQLGLSGPILWTELAKCENAPGRAGLPPLDTLRRCTGLYLRRELAAIPPSWPLIAVGSEAFKALAYLHTERTVLGLPHPTGSYGHFARLSSDGRLRPSVVAAAGVALSFASGTLLWVESVDDREHSR
jgi:Uracil DNA glycosylase superfamily